MCARPDTGASARKRYSTRSSDALCPAYVSIRQHTSKRYSTRSSDALCPAYVSVCQHTSAYVEEILHTLLQRTVSSTQPLSIRQHTSAYVSIPDTVSSAQTLRRLSHINRRRQCVTCGRVSDWVAKGGHALGIHSLVQVCLRAAALVSVFVLFCTRKTSRVSRQSSGHSQFCACVPELVSIRQHTSAYVPRACGTCQHTSAYVSIRQHTSASVSIIASSMWTSSAYVSIRQHASAYLPRACETCQPVRDGRAGSLCLLSMCQYLYFCTSKASKLKRSRWFSLPAARGAAAFLLSTLASAYVSIRQHRIRQHTSAYVSVLAKHTRICICQHTSAYVRIAYVSIRQRSCQAHSHLHMSAYVSVHQNRIRQHTSAYVLSALVPGGFPSCTHTPRRIHQHTPAYVSIRQHTSAYVSIRAWGTPVSHAPRRLPRQISDAPLSHLSGARCTHLQRQNSYFCTGKASKLSTCTHLPRKLRRVGGSMRL
jgi:hypothetical protein